MEYTHRCVVFALTSRVGCRYNAVNMGWGVFVKIIKSDLPPAAVIAVSCVIRWWIGRLHNGFESHSMDIFSTLIGFIPFPQPIST